MHTFIIYPLTKYHLFHIQLVEENIKITNEQINNK